jgi:hypothetical protein
MLAIRGFRKWELVAISPHSHEQSFGYGGRLGRRVMKSLFLKFAFIFFMSPALATDYYAALWKAEAPAISTGRNSDDNTFVGYNTGDWPSVGNVTTIENLEELMTVMEGDAFGPHTLYLWHGTFDDAGDFLRLDDLNTQSLTVVGQGDTTILDGSKFSGTSAVFVNGRSGMTFRNFKISGGVEAFRFSDAGFSEYAKNPTGNTIDSVTMENQSEYGVRLSCAQDSYTDFTLKNSVITDNNQDVEGVRFITYSDCSINAIKILDNTWTGLEVGIHFFSLEQNAGFNNASPYDVLIEGNRIIDTYGYGIVFQSGLKSGTGTTSYVRNNYLEDIGKTNSPNVNGIQLSWCHDLIVEKNTINKVTTSKPDGHGIIADWAWRDNNYLSDGVIIRENTIYGLDSLNCDFALSAGINVYKAKNTIVHHNVSYNNCVGFKLTRPESTGTLFYNNTAYGNILSNVRVDLSAPASVWKNNIFDGGGITPYGVFTANTGTVFPTMSNNIFYNHTTAEKYDWVASEPVSLGVGSRIIDPQLISNYKLAENTPAIDAADESVLSDLTEAVSINGVVIKTSSGESFPLGGGKLDIGAYEYIAAAELNVDSPPDEVSEPSLASEPEISQSGGSGGGSCSIIESSTGFNFTMPLLLTFALGLGWRRRLQSVC